MQYKEVAVGGTVYFWFAANLTTGAAGDGATPLYDVRLAGAASSAAPTASGTPTLLSHANYTDGLHEIAIDTTAYATGEYAVFCTLTISSVNPAGFCGSFLVTAASDTSRDRLAALQAGVRLADAVVHGGTTATLRLGGTTATPALHVTNSGGTAVQFESNGGNGGGLVAAGNGTGNGIYAASGAGSTASGILAVSNATVAGGAGIYALGSGSAASPGIFAAGNGAAGISAYGGNNNPGILAAGQGTGDGLQCASGFGATGNGIKALSNATNGNGMSLTKAGTGLDLKLETPSTNADDAILAILGTPAGASLSADIADIPTSAESAEIQDIVDAMLDEANADHLDAGTIGLAISTGGTAAGLITSVATKVLKYFQLALRKDAAIATDNATEVNEINADEGSGAGAFANTTDSGEAVADAVATRSSQTSVDDLPTNTELATALGTADDAVLVEIGAVRLQTDQLTFTVTGIVDANMQRVNDVALTGDGSAGDKFDVV